MSEARNGVVPTFRKHMFVEPRNRITGLLQVRNLREAFSAGWLNSGSESLFT